MIKSITVTNYLGDSIKLDLANPEPSGFAVTSITGLGPGKANVNTTEISTTDGGLYNSARVPVRNIVLSLRYLWSDSIEEARHRSYKYFPLKHKVHLLIETDTRQSEIEGYVESNEPTIFSSEESTDISIICPNPFFYSVTSATTVFSGIEPVFEFPFSNESLSAPLLEMSIIRQNMDETIFYDGDVETGIIMTISASGSATGITIYNIGTREIMRIDTDKLASITGYGVMAGDQITISTEPGNKYIHLLRNGVTTNILNCLDRDSAWFKLSKGENIFAYTADTGEGNLQFSIENRVVYEGV